MNHPGMDVSELIGRVEAEMRRTGYSDLSIERHTAVWNNLTDYMGNGKTIFTAKVAMDFLEATYGITVCKELDSEKKRIVPERSIYL
jgi:hypothetical protein